MRRVRASAALARLPWWVALGLGLLAVALGLALTGRPFDSLDALVLMVGSAFVIVGAGELASARGALDVLAAAAWVVAGVAAVAWPGLTVEALAILVGAGLLAGGALRLAAAARDRADDRATALLGGAASVILGVLALAWPDLTVLGVSLLVGPAVVLFGARQVIAALRRRRGGAPTRAWPRRLRLGGAAALLLAAVGLAVLSGWINDSAAEPDAFYTAPDDVPPQPGVLLRSERWDGATPAGAEAWRLLYTTTRDDGVPAVASALAIVAEDRPPGPRPVIAWAHGTTGVVPRCAPSVLRASLAGSVPALDELVARGWVLVTSDYVGLGTEGPHPYLIGQGQARSVLDAVRAARELEDVAMDDRTVVWGHSQGGHAALWTGIVAPTYAPDVDVIGVAALAPAADLIPLVRAVQDTPAGQVIGTFVAAAYAAAYPEVRFEGYVRPQARVIAREIAGRCLSGPEALPSFAAALALDRSLFAGDPTAGPLGRRLAENTPDARIEAPLLIAQGLADGLVVPDVQTPYAERLCAEGQRLEYRTYAGEDHVSVLADGSALVPDLLAWTDDRLAGRAPPSGCSTVER